MLLSLLVLLTGGLHATGARTPKKSLYVGMEKISGMRNGRTLPGLPLSILMAQPPLTQPTPPGVLFPPPPLPLAQPTPPELLLSVLKAQLSLAQPTSPGVLFPPPQLPLAQPTLPGLLLSVLLVQLLLAQPSVRLPQSDYGLRMLLQFNKQKQQSDLRDPCTTSPETLSIASATG